MDDSAIDLKKYGMLLRRWGWLIILGFLLGAGAGYGVSVVQTPVYEATSKVMIARNGQDQLLDVTSNLYGNQLSQTYLQLLRTSTVMAAVSERLEIDFSDVKIDSQAIPDTSIIEINVEHTNPQLAADIANTLVDVLIEKNETIQSTRYVAMEASLIAQKTQIEEQITNLQSQIELASLNTVAEQEKWLEEQIDDLEAEDESLPGEISALTNSTDPADLEKLEQKKARLEQVKILLQLYQQSYTDLVVYGTQPDTAQSPENSQLSLLTATQTLYQQLYGSILSNLESVRLANLQNTPNVVPIEPAITPQVPVRPQPIRNAVFAGLLGLMLVSGSVLLGEFLDNSIKITDDIEELTGLNPIGYIMEIRNNTKGEEGLYVFNQPRSPVSEAFRTLRTNIEFSSVDKPIKTILITSPEPGAGKTIVATNLAIVFAQKGKRVLLVDADLRRPQVHRLMSLRNRLGITDLLLGDLDANRVIQKLTGLESLFMLTSGGLPPNPAELLGSKKMEQTLSKLGDTVDIIIIDSPPTIVSDAQILSAKVDGVIVVAKIGKTLKQDIKYTVESLIHANARIIGIVLNRIPRAGGNYYNRYHYKGYESIGESDTKYVPKVSK